MRCSRTVESTSQDPRRVASWSNLRRILRHLRPSSNSVELQAPRQVAQDVRDDTTPVIMMATAIITNVDAAAASKYKVSNHAAMDSCDLIDVMLAWEQISTAFQIGLLEEDETRPAKQYIHHVACKPYT